MKPESEAAKSYPNAHRPAFPTNARMFEAAQGMTKREYFAAKAMLGLIQYAEGEQYHEIARDAVVIADALIEALNK